MKRKREPEPEQGPNKQQKLNYSNILIAIVNNDIEAVKFHIAKDPELVFHQKPIGTQTFVHFAVTSTGIFRKLIEAGADTDAKSNNAWSPLHFAAINGNTEIVKALIAAGADINAKSNNAWSSLHFAAENGHTETVKALIAAGADIEAKAKLIDNKTGVVNEIIPLHFAAKNGHTETVKALIEAGADIETEDSSDLEFTPLHFAVINGHTETVKVLIAAGADIEARDYLDHTPLFNAVSYEHVEIIKALTEAGADIDAERYEDTLLMEAVEYGYTKAIKPLIEAGAEMNELTFQCFHKERLDPNSIKSLKSLIIVQNIFKEAAEYQYREEEYKRLQELNKDLKEHIQSSTAPDCNEQDLVEYVNIFNAIFKKKLIEATKQTQVINEVCNLINLVRDNITKESNLPSFIAEKIVEHSNLSLFMSEGQYSDKSMFRALSEKKYAIPLMTTILIKGALREIDLEEISKSSGKLINQDLMDKLSQFREILLFNNKKTESAKKGDIEIRTTQEEVPDHMHLDDVSAAGSYISALDTVD